MQQLTISTIAEFAGAELNDDRFANQLVGNVSIDTRTIHEGDIYMPIIGERLDGHDFIDQAFEKGAVGCFCDRSHTIGCADGRCFLYVDDTLDAFQTLAQNYRASLDVRIVGITGSNGKTTTKDILKSVLSRRFNTRKTIGNLNNLIGTPKTLLTLDETTEIGVIEMGMDKFGEISRLVALARPEVAVITNVGDSHLEVLKTRENVALAKLEILEGMTADQLFLYNRDDDVLSAAVADRTILPEVRSYGTHPDADYVLKLVRSNAQGSEFTLNGEAWTINLLGGYQMYNAAVAIIVAKHFGLTHDEIQSGLFVTERTAMRTELKPCDGYDIMVDCYKSNPQSLLEALNTIKLLAGYKRKLAILGDMLELGDQELALHRSVGESLDPNDLDAVLFYGSLSAAMMEGAMPNFGPGRLFHFDSKADLVDKAKSLIKKNTLVLVKGSRGMRLEEVIENIEDVTAH